MLIGLKTKSFDTMLPKFKWVKGSLYWSLTVWSVHSRWLCLHWLTGASPDFVPPLILLSVPPLIDQYALPVPYSHELLTP